MDHPVLTPVALLADVPEHGLTRGQIGTVIERLKRDGKRRCWSSSPTATDRPTPRQFCAPSKNPPSSARCGLYFLADREFGSALNLYPRKTRHQRHAHLPNRRESAPLPFAILKFHPSKSMKILVAEPLAAAGIELLKAQPGWDVVVADPKTYAQHLADADALLVRSAVKVNQDVLSKAPKLRVIGRAGVGVDNVDLKAATAAGVLVMNTPGGNAVSVAEHTLGLMLAMARSIPQANASTKGGKWEKKKFLGTELRGKTLGVMGLGSIGREVVKRARAFGMKIVATDPFVSSQSAADLGITLVSLDGAVRAERLHHAARRADHRDPGHDQRRDARHDEEGRAHRELRPRRTDGWRRSAQGASNRAMWAAPRWTFSRPSLPPRASLCWLFENVLATPHIGGSTEEAQEIVGVRIVEQLVEYLQHGVALNAVNVPAMTAEQYKAVGPYIDLAERLGNFAAYVATGNPSSVRLIYQGKIGEQNTALMRNAGLAGVLCRSHGAARQCG